MTQAELATVKEALLNAASMSLPPSWQKQNQMAIKIIVYEEIKANRRTITAEDIAAPTSAQQ